MPRKDKSGPPRGSTGPRDGRGKGKGNYSGSKKGVGKQKGGKRGIKSKERQKWQHEDTGRIAEFPLGYSPGRRWYPVVFS